MTMWRVLSIVLAAHVASPSAAAQQLEPLAMSYVPGNAIAWDLDVAMDRGLLKAEGFDGRPVVFQNAPQSAQMLISGEVQLGTGQIDPFLLAFRSGARDIAVIAAPAERPDWFLNVRPEIRTVADLKGKFVATAALQVGESWLTSKWLDEQGLKAQDWSLLVVGTSALKYAALQRGSVAAAIMFQPLALEAQLAGFPTMYRFLEGRPFPPVLYVVNRRWAAEKERGRRLSRAIVEAHLMAARSGKSRRGDRDPAAIYQARHAGDGGGLRSLHRQGQALQRGRRRRSGRCRCRGRDHDREGRAAGRHTDAAAGLHAAARAGRPLPVSASARLIAVSGLGASLWRERLAPREVITSKLIEP